MHTDFPIKHGVMLHHAGSGSSSTCSRVATKRKPKVAMTHSFVGMLHLLTKDYVTCTCTYIHTDSASSKNGTVVSASSNRRGTKNEPKVAKTHSSVGMLHLLTKDYVTCACTNIQTLPPLLCQQVVVEEVRRTSLRWPRHILLSVCYIKYYVTCVCTCIQTLSPLLCQLVLIEGV